MLSEIHCFILAPSPNICLLLYTIYILLFTQWYFMASIRASDDGIHTQSYLSQHPCDVKSYYYPY